MYHCCLCFAMFPCEFFPTFDDCFLLLQYWTGSNNNKRYPPPTSTRLVSDFLTEIFLLLHILHWAAGSHDIVVLYLIAWHCWCCWFGINILRLQLVVIAFDWIFSTRSWEQIQLTVSTPSIITQISLPELSRPEFYWMKADMFYQCMALWSIVITLLLCIF